jgi:hypothetical protein
VIVVAIAVVLVTLSMRGCQQREALSRDATRRDLDDAHERLGRSEQEHEIAHDEAEKESGP